VTSTSKRPFVLTCFSLILLFGFVCFPIYALTAPSQATLAFVISQYGVGTFVVRQFGSQVFAFGIALLSLSAGITGIGLWRLRPWARRSVITYAALTICSAFARIIEFRTAPNPGSLDLTDALLSVLLLVYFFRPKIKRLFQRNVPTEAVALT